MASREKKATVGKKLESALPLPPKERDESPESLTKTAPILEKEVIQVKKTEQVRRIRKKNDTKNIINKRSFKAKLKGKGKVNAKLAKSVLTKAKNSAAVKKTLLKNGVAKTKVIRKKPQCKEITKQIDDQEDKPPVLEPIYPIEENSIEKKPAKKKAVPKKPESEANICSITETIESIIIKASDTEKPQKKPKPVKKTKDSTIESIVESIEGVVKEMCLIKTEDIKIEPDCEPLKNEKVKKAAAKKVKVDAVNKRVKKEDIENALIKVDTSESNVIEMLDLNVRKVINKAVVNRRHSIEKFPITTQEVKEQDNSIFSNLPRSISPKNKRSGKMRQSLDSKRSSPYITRSDSPARILRNGKQRKLKHLNLLEGLDSEYKKRRRLCSDYSGSEISVSKMSGGYESDSSYSDMVSLPGTENSENADVSKDLLLKKELLETLENNPPDSIEARAISANLAATIKRSLSVEAAAQELQSKLIDTNSNVCPELTAETPVKTESVAFNILPSFKVPEKSVILGIMKQTFNDIVAEDQQESERRKTRSSARKNQKSSVDEPSVSTSQVPENLNELTTTVDQLTEVVVDEAQHEPEIENIPMTVDEIVENGRSMDNIPILVPIEVKEILEEVDVETIETELENMERNSDINPELNISESSKSPEISESPENLAIKTEILQALGLQSLQAAEEAKLKKVVPKPESYTGTLKTVIKLNRCDKKKGRNSLKMTLQKKGKSHHGKDDDPVGMEEDEYKIMKEGNSTWKSQAGSQSSDTAGALRKSHYSNRSNMDGSSEHTSDGDTNVNEDGSDKLLVIPEKASSFSIHPGRLCKDECSYCFGKFGLFDTPCHIAQMKTVERQNKILSVEKHLTRDSCLCDACYRHVDRKSNAPSYASNKSLKRNSLVAPGPRQNHCHVLGCGRVATNILKRKWLIKMRKSVCQVINIDLDNPGLHSIPICEEHYAALEHLMVCAMCKRRLARNHIHYLGTESNDLNAALNEMGLPVKLHDRPVVCKLCRYFATIVLKNPEDRNENSANFFVEYRKRLLHFHNIELMNDSQAEEPIPAPMKDKPEKEQNKKKKKLSKNNNLEPPVLEPQVDIGHKDESKNRVPSTDSRAESPSDFMIDYNSLVPNIAMEYGNDIEVTRKEISKKNSVSIKRIAKPESLRDVEKSKKFRNNSDMAVQRLGSNPSISVRQLFPGEEDLSLNGTIEFHNVKERTPEGWEKCISTIQYDPDIKMLWGELQKPYGNQSSFLRHLILLEKYFRNGDLVLSPTASHHSVNYTESIQNRLKSYDNIPSNVGTVQPLTMIPFNKPLTKVTISSKAIKEILPTCIVPQVPCVQHVPHVQHIPQVPYVQHVPQVPHVQHLSQVSHIQHVPSQTSTQSSPSSITTSSAVQSPVPKTVPVTISSVNSSSFLVPNPAAIVGSVTNPITIAPAPPTRPKLPPGLISLQPGTKIPVTSLVKLPQSQKIKFPITKNWRPNLIPIDPTKKPEKKPGLVQVISGGKPYHISLEDYKKMCAIKRTFDLRQKRIQETKRGSTESLLKGIPSRKGLIISKAATVSPTKTDSNSDQESENTLEKLDKTVEKLESNLNDKGMTMPKIPKSLTVIPQTVPKKSSRPPSPTVLITPKTKPTGKS